ncbi:MAG TPA: hypothetical protein VIL08_01195, partial [Limnochorda sp.]
MDRAPVPPAPDHWGAWTHRAPAWLVGVAACRPPYPLANRWLIELLVVADPLPPAALRPKLLRGPSACILKLFWRSVAGLAYPSPFHLEAARRGSILYD